jgi:glycosyltransferase involved in cell wall biosynthesis
MNATQGSFWRVPNRIAYVLSHTYPYSTNGYAVRSHGIAKALVNHGHSVIAVTRPGRPWDILGIESEDIPAHQEIDRVRYLYQNMPHSWALSSDQWQDLATVALEKTFSLFKPSIVMAASNWENALPAFNAARKFNIPFFYEVRGFWEITRLSREPEWYTTEAFRDSVAKESFIARSAVRVFTLNHHMKDELIQRGVDRGKIDLVPNAWDDLQSVSTGSEDIRYFRTRYVVGYVGSFSAYEGLDDLVRACAAVRKSGVDLSLVLVGSSSPVLQNQSTTTCKVSSELIAIAKELGFDSHLHMVGRVAPSELGNYYNQMDLVVLPRKAHPVSELVSPIKPIEAAAYGKPMLVSDVAGLDDVVQEGGARSFRKSDLHDLAEKIRLLLLDEIARRVMALKARAWIASARTFQRVTQPMVAAFRGPDRPSLPIVDKDKVGFRILPHPESTDGNIESISSAIESSAVEIFGNQSKNTISSIEITAKKTDDNSFFRDSLVSALKVGGPKALEALLDSHVKGRTGKFTATSEIQAANVLLSEGHIDAAVSMTNSAIQKEANKSNLRSAAKIFHDAALLDRAVEISKHFLALVKDPSAQDRKLFTEILAKKQLVDWLAQPPVKRTLNTIERKVLNILAFSLPFASVGYATRSHGLAIGIKNAGWDIRPYTRPGFPYDFKPELIPNSVAEADEIDGLIYRRSFQIERRGMSETDYLLAAIGYWEKIIEQERPAIVHAASNYVTALPAMIAARRKGIPFIYEIRGFWEVTRSSRDNTFVNTAKYRYMRFFESLVACGADRVITITNAMKEELASCGVLNDDISIAFNSVDPQRFAVRPRDLELATKLGIPKTDTVIGYIGTLVDYEGLDDLLLACAGLVKSNIKFRLMLVGDGAQAEILRQQVTELGLEGVCHLVGRVPHEEVEAYYSLVDIAPFPRKPWDVCEIVSPLKPFEAMALEKAVVVSNTRALSEIVTHDMNGLHFEKGSVASLQKSLTRLCEDKEYRLRLGRAARKWILEQRTWDTAGQVCVESYKTAIESKSIIQSELSQLSMAAIN